MLGKLLGRLKEGLAKTRRNILGRIEDVVRRRGRIDEEMLEEIEEILIGADVGVDTTLKIMDAVRARVQRERISESERIIGLLKEEVAGVLSCANEGKDARMDGGPQVVLLIGVNGTGKTTTIGKLAKRYRDQGKKVLLAACDTFRAAAIEQLEIWADRAGADLVRHQAGADAAAVAFDAVSASKARGTDVLIVDTAGRLHTKVNLMEELKKIHRVLGNAMEGAPHECLLVLDATTGQNALAQARQFDAALGVTGLVLTKLDGTAKGGIVIALADQLDLPVRMIGIGEQLDDLRDFDPQEFADALFE